jgi:hypothetical protein
MSDSKYPPRSLLPEITRLSVRCKDLTAEVHHLRIQRIEQRTRLEILAKRVEVQHGVPGWSVAREIREAMRGPDGHGDD